MSISTVYHYFSILTSSRSERRSSERQSFLYPNPTLSCNSKREKVQIMSSDVPLLSFSFREALIWAALVNFLPKSNSILQFKDGEGANDELFGPLALIRETPLRNKCNYLKKHLWIRKHHPREEMYAIFRHDLHYFAS